jgi:hypothetical protein
LSKPERLFNYSRSILLKQSRLSKYRRSIMDKEYIPDHAWTVANALRAAATRYREHVEQFTAIAETGGNAFMTVDAAKRMAEQFSRQADEAVEYAYEFENSDGFTIINVDLEEE